jgi:predicted GNAT family N-acyltransferase
VAKEYRGKNYGIGIMQAAEQEIAADFAKISDKSADPKLIIELSAQCRVQKFYEKQGYVPCGEIFYDEYCAHIKMRKELVWYADHNK